MDKFITLGEYVQHKTGTFGFFMSKEQEFGFVEYGGKGTTSYFGDHAKTSEALDLGGLLAAADGLKDFAEGFPDATEFLEDASKAVGGTSKLTSILLNLSYSLNKIGSDKDAAEEAGKLESSNDHKPYKGKKVGDIIYEGENIEGKPIKNLVNKDGTGTCCQTGPATDTGVGKKKIKN